MPLPNQFGFHWKWEGYTNLSGGNPGEVFCYILLRSLFMVKGCKPIAFLSKDCSEVHDNFCFALYDPLQHLTSRFVTLHHITSCSLHAHSNPLHCMTLHATTVHAIARHIARTQAHVCQRAVLKKSDSQEWTPEGKDAFTKFCTVLSV